MTAGELIVKLQAADPAAQVEFSISEAYSKVHHWVWQGHHQEMKLRVAQSNGDLVEILL